MKSVNNRPIAILLAAYNADKYLEEQINSLLSQTNQEWTLYIRNDGSKDNTGNIIEHYVAQYPDKIVEVDKGGKNLGCYNNFFRLLDAVESDYYMFCDADDVWLPEKVERSFLFLKEQERKYPGKPLLVHTDEVVCDSELNILKRSAWKANHIDPDLFVSFFDLPIYIVGGACAIFNSELGEHARIKPPFKMSHDGWVALNAAKYGKITALHEPLILYRQHGRNTAGFKAKSTKSIAGKILNFRNIIREHNKFAKELRKFGYGSLIKYYLSRIMVRVKLLWCKIAVR